MIGAKRRFDEITEPNYPRNCWWVAGTIDEIGSQPIARRLLGEAIVLYRTGDGRAAALADRCPHRWASLSKGYVEGNELVCGYHGARFGANGKCHVFPTQDKVPEEAKVRSYPVIEQFPFIWIWMGDPEGIADAPKPYRFDWAENADHLVARGSTPIDANYFLIHENLLDLTHFNYTHRNSLGVDDTPVAKFSRDGDRVSFLMRKEDTQLTAVERAVVGVDHRFNRVINAWFETPAVHVGHVELYDREATGQERTNYTSWITHLVTPAAPGITHYWWIFARDYGTDASPEELAVGLDFIFREDKVMLENIQANAALDMGKGESTEVSFNGDMGGLLARRVLKKLLQAEL